MLSINLAHYNIITPTLCYSAILCLSLSVCIVITKIAARDLRYLKTFHFLFFKHGALIYTCLSLSRNL